MSNSIELVKPIKLGDHLVKSGVITESQLKASLEEQAVTQERLGIILVRNGFIQRKALIAAILDTRPEQIHGESLFTAKVPPEVILNNKLMVVAENLDTVYLATLGSEKQALAEISPYYPTSNIEFVSADLDQVDAYLEDVRSMSEDEFSLVDKLIRKAFSDNISDIHIIPKYSSYSIFYRHLGVRKLVHEGSLDENTSLVARIKDMSKMDLAERRLPQDGGFSMEYNGKLVDLRVSTIPTNNGEVVVMRLLDPDKVQPSLEGLGITNVDQWRKGVSRPDGLCLICGPTGSGKTTTLNASIKELDRFGSSIYTLEDPVEYRIPYVSQVNINHLLGLDFAKGIRAFMRADPDVIIVGEIRDAETARNALRAAETGHLVLGTLHTGSIHGAIQRLKDLEVPPNELAYLLRTVLVQRLVRTICPDCLGEGCPTCLSTGYAGRTIVSECTYFSSEDEVNKVVLGNEKWWPSMMEDAVLKEKQGVTTEKEVIRVFGQDAKDLFDEGSK